MAIDHRVGILSDRGGSNEAQQRLKKFVSDLLPRYAEEAKQPDDKVRGGLSPYMHFGHISPHQMFDALMSREQWTPAKLAKVGRGNREDWWGVSASAEAWLDQFITWRELGYNMSSKRTDYDQYDSLPDWAQTTLAKHARDRRKRLYSLDEFAEARTHDPLWNAAQRQLLREGRIHNYLRMLWGKKILEWSHSPHEALEVMIELNNRYAIDGRNPNSYSGIFWVLGRYDRPWGPERPIYGTVRYMSSENTRRKLRVTNYLEQFGDVGG
jgi:deoxyribodipyrimidine photo-lyase